MTTYQESQPLPEMNSNPKMQEEDDDDDNESEETLSLCDLPIYQDSSKELYQSSSISSSQGQDDLFEFFPSQQLPTCKTKNTQKLKSQKNPSLRKSGSTFEKSKSTSRSKLLLILLGLPPKIPTDKMELMTDIRNRQSRRAPPTLFPSDGCADGGEEVVRFCRKSDKGLWRFGRAASCFGCQVMQTAVL